MRRKVDLFGMIGIVGHHAIVIQRSDLFKFDMNTAARAAHKHRYGRRGVVQPAAKFRPVSVQ